MEEGEGAGAALSEGGQGVELLRLRPRGGVFTPEIVTKMKQRFFFLSPFQIVTSYHPPKSQYSSALLICNQSKNRSPDLLATDSSRIYLTPSSDRDDSDYINASWLPGESGPLLLLKSYPGWRLTDTHIEHLANTCASRHQLFPFVENV